MDKQTKPAAPPPDVQLCTVEETMYLLRLSRAGLYAAINRGDIRVRKIGRRTFIPRSVIEQIAA